MSSRPSPEDPEPFERVPAGPLYVPVLPGPAGCTARLFRTPLGARTAVGFTSERRLAAVLGPDQRWVRLRRGALRSLAEPLGAGLLTVDPQLAAPPAAAETEEAAAVEEGTALRRGGEHGVRAAPSPGRRREPARGDLGRGLGTGTGTGTDLVRRIG